jgi:hypothetical protein
VADHEFSNSFAITEPLAKFILDQTVELNAVLKLNMNNSETCQRRKQKTEGRADDRNTGLAYQHYMYKRRGFLLGSEHSLVKSMEYFIQMGLQGHPSIELWVATK